MRLCACGILDIYEIVNIARRQLRPDELRFIQEYAALLAPRGLPPSAGRVLGYLMLLQKQVSLDQIALDLDMSKAGAWNAAKVLERCGHVRRYGAPASKRSLYAPSSDFAAPFLDQMAILGELSKLLQKCALDTASPDAAGALKDHARFYRTIKTSTETAIKNWTPSRARK